jgi:hypothetical protein
VACLKFDKFLKNRLTFFSIVRYYVYMFYRLGRKAPDINLFCYGLYCAPFLGFGINLPPPPPP